MKRSWLFTAAAAAVLELAGGCAVTPSQSPVQYTIPPFKAAPAVLQQRQSAFKAATAQVRSKVVAFYPAALSGRITGEAMLAKVQQLGFTGVMCELTSEAELNDDLRSFMLLCAQKNIPFEFMIRESYFYRKRHGNQLIRPLLHNYPDYRQMVERVIAFINSDKENVLPAAGITVVISPHLISDSDSERGYNQLYSWSEESFGAGLDNDMLVKRALQQLREIAALPGLPPLTIGVPDFYHELANSGKLSCGKVGDFLKISPRLLVISSGNLPTMLVKTVQDELAAAPAESSVRIAVELADHVVVNQQQLRRRNWQDFCRALEYATGKYVKNHAFKGVVLSPFSMIDFLYQER